MKFWKELLRRAEEEHPPSTAAVILKALDKGQVQEIIPVLPAVEREVVLWHTRQNNLHNKRWELLYLLLGLLFGGGTGAGLTKLFSTVGEATHLTTSEDK
jgi:hypothetical protein